MWKLFWFNVQARIRERLTRPASIALEQPIERELAGLIKLPRYRRTHEGQKGRTIESALQRRLA